MSILWATTASPLGMNALTSPPSEESVPVTKIKLNPAELSRTEIDLITSFEHLDSTVTEIKLTHGPFSCVILYPLHPPALYFCLNLNLDHLQWSLD